MGCEQVVAINPEDGTAALRKKDPERFSEVKGRFNTLMARYKSECASVEAAWREAYPRFTSLLFWREYLGLM